MVAMGVLFMAPSMDLRSMFWSSLFVRVMAAVAHALALYSTFPVYTVFRIRGDAPLCVPESSFRRASFLMPLFVMDSICGFDERQESGNNKKQQYIYS